MLPFQYPKCKEAFFLILFQISLLFISETYTAHAAFTGEISASLFQSGNSSQDCLVPQNPIVAENCHPGSTGWMVENNLADIEGFAYPLSANIGEMVSFYVNTTSEQFTAEIYRSGYYGGAGARLLQTVEGLVGVAQPDCLSDYNTGLISCSNWESSYQLFIPEDWVSGIYLVRLLRPDSGGTAYMQFVVRDDARSSDILYQQSTSTYQAYNNYKGPSVYDNSDSAGAHECTRDSGTDRAVKVSLMRPYSQDFFEFDNLYIYTEYPMVRWLEAQGYDVTYSTNFDTHRSGEEGQTNHLLNHQAFLSVGHDEYWSNEMRNAITEARDGGVHLGFFSANTAYWKVRMEDDPYTDEPNSVMVTYKTTQSGPVDPSGIPTGTWRDPTGANFPENELIGNLYLGDNDPLYFPLRVTAEQGMSDVYRYTDLQTMPPDSYAVIAEDIFGWEWNAALDNGFSPQGLEIVASSPVYGYLLLDAGNYINGASGPATADTTWYVAPSRANVFSSGTILWSWGLGAHGIESVPVNPYIQQVTYNILADLGAQPASPTDDLILDGDDNREVRGIDIRPTGDILPPTIQDIQVSVSGNHVEITWQTDVETRGQVWHGSSPQNLINFWNPESGEYSQSHTVSRTLEYGTQYYYQIVVTDGEGNFDSTPVDSFLTEEGAIVQRIRDTLALGNIPISIRCNYLENPVRTIATGLVLALAVFGVAALILRTIMKRSLPSSIGVRNT